MTAHCDCNRSFKHESMQDVDSVLQYLDAVREGLRSGALTLSSQGESVILEPRGLVKCDIQAKCKEGRCKLALKFSWKDEKTEAGSEPLVIEPGHAAGSES